MEEFEPIDIKASKKKKRGKSNTGLVVLLIVMSFVVLSSLVVAAMSLKLYYDSKEVKEDPAIVDVQTEKTYTQSEVDAMLEEAKIEEDAIALARFKKDLKESAESSSGLLNTLRAMYPEYIVTYYGNKYNFIEIDPDLAPANFINENIIANNGFMEYREDGAVKSVKGIDVSKFQGDIDWVKVKESGVDYVMIRLGIRGYETGKLALDENFDKNIQGATDAGIDVGVYFFTQAINEAEAREEAQFVIDAIAPYNITYPVVIDVEDLYNDNARSAGQSMESRTSCAKAFMDAIAAAGYKPAIYGNLATFSRLVNINELGDYDKWYAYYESNIYFPYKISMWQYSDKGSIDGIEGDVDLNIAFPAE